MQFDTIIETMREYLGEADFYKIIYGSNYSWDYSAMIEYFFAGMLLLITVNFVFRLVLKLFSR